MKFCNITEKTFRAFPPKKDKSGAYKLIKKASSITTEKLKDPSLVIGKDARKMKKLIYYLFEKKSI